ncbi:MULTISPECIES: FtsX-like permease family protein [unclassified Pseudodesulfovibrio]|uniref:ABC transporter permease n=1 Tax=unclassified Pseudodesulfovibrio TaxID=2661612 RepID=UPI000FEBAA88|nr:MULTISPECIES: FtsX-like permease family protein [unclassified Pseudodesulfovibrio]MCJ2166167.1 FtsX-like permease family protein [Pseudodesulfovibrio sp. S3-i]RWU02366.1 ABC transporter permease [Pseudodesulfovibrio sp. S3]
MNILTIPLRNTRRKWVKTLLLLLVFSLGVTSIVSLNYVSSVVGESLEKKLTAFGANILIMPKNEKLTVSYGGFAMGDMAFGVHDMSESAVVEKAKTIELKDRIAVVAPKLVAMATVGDMAVGVVGVRWEKEKILKGYWAVNGAFPTEKDGVVVGSKAAASLGLQAGSVFDLNDVSVRASGILMPTGSDDDSVVFMGMDLAQQHFGVRDRVNFVEVAALCAGCPIEDIVAQLRSSLPETDIQALQSIVKQRMYSVNFVKQLILTVSLVILFIACCMVGVTMLASVNERIKEIGLMRSLGFSRGSIFSIFCFEAMLIGLGSGVIGYVGGYWLSLKVLSMLDMAEGAVVSFNLGHLALTGLFIVTVSVLSAFFPAWKAASVEPSEALISL